MKSPENAIEFIFDSTLSFEERCMKIYRYQVEHNPTFKRFVESFGLGNSDNPGSKKIPLLPIRGFKEGKIVIDSAKKEPELIFKSSGTVEMNRSTHFILSQQIYEHAILEEFSNHFKFDEYIVLFYMPGYDKNPQSSLIWMANHLVKSDPSGQSQFVSFEDLTAMASGFPARGKKVLLFGAAFGLIDALETGKFKLLGEVEILETGGMKTYRREMTKTELRQTLSEGFEIPMENIHSEYGMCELLSQMYAIGGSWFQTPHWVQVTIRDSKNPSRICETGEEGKIGIIDLANIYSCPFILTDDKGVIDDLGRFKVLGRWNPKDLRGCNFLIDRE